MRVIAFYSFFDISNPKKLKEEINLFFLLKKIKGSILVSKEGLNGTITVTQKKEKNTKEKSQKNPYLTSPNTHPQILKKLILLFV